MSYTSSGYSRIQIPPFPVGGPLPPSDIWTGRGADDGFFAFSLGGVWTISDRLCYSLEWGSETLVPYWAGVNGWMAWKGVSKCLYYEAGTGEWVLMPAEKLGYIPVPDSDAYYFADFSGTADFSPVRLEGGGLALGQSEILTISWRRWTKEGNRFGVYAPAFGNVPGRVFGSPFWESDGEEFVRSADPVDGLYTYGSVHNDGAGWLIGSRGSAAGWWEGEEPQPEAPAMFAFCRQTDSEAAGENKVLSWAGYCQGPGREKELVGEVALWR